jgi:hypothetical protein
MRSLVSASVATSLVCLVLTAHAAPLTPGNVLITQDDEVVECTTSGTVIQSFPVPYGGGERPVTESARDVVVGADGRAHVYNGTFEPFLSTLDPMTSSWSHEMYPAWSTVNNITFGGIAVFQASVFATDMGTSGDPSAHGIIRFDLGTDAAMRFATENEFIDVTLGLDGLLYGLEEFEETVEIYDPATLEHVKTIELGAECRGLAVNASGEIFGVSLDGNLYRFAPTGAVLATVPSGTSGLTDIDVDANGRIIIGADSGEVIQTDETLGATSSFLLNQLPVFVAFTSPAAPGCPNGPPCGEGGGGAGGGGTGSSSNTETGETTGGNTNLDDDDDDGCGCRQTNPGRGSGIFLALVTALALRRRRPGKRTRSNTADGEIS